MSLSLKLTQVNCHSSVCKKSAVSATWVTTYIPSCGRGGSDAVRLLVCFSVQGTVLDFFSQQQQTNLYVQAIVPVYLPHNLLNLLF